MYARRRRRYFTMMAICLVLFVSAWAFVRLWSVPAAIAMCAVAMVIPPLAAITANKREADDRWWDEPGDDPGAEPGERPTDAQGGGSPGRRSRAGRSRAGQPRGRRH